MATRRHASLKPHLNQVRGWVEMGATDVWIAHQLGSTPASIAAFRQKHGLLRTGAAAPAEAPAERPARAPRPPRARRADAAPAEAEAPPPATPQPPAEVAADARDEGAEEAGERPKRRRGRRGGRGRARTGPPGATVAAEPVEVEGVFDHGEDGYGLWLDAAVRDSAVYRAHWQGHREIAVRVTPDEIVIRRSGAPAADGDDANDDAG